MPNRTSPYPDGIPVKPDRIASNPVASSEWDRICAALLGERALSPMWGPIIEVTAASYASFVQLGGEMAQYGRTKEFAILQAQELECYLAACKECAVDPHPSVRLRRPLPGEDHRTNTEEGT